MREYAPTARPYELMTILTPDVADDQVLDQLETVAGYVRTAGGAVYQVLHDAPWGRRRFAYPIRHNGRDVRDGFYSIVHFDLAPAQVTEVERDLRLDERVLRFLLTLNEPIEEKPTGTEGAEGSEPAAPVVRTEIAAGDLIRNAQAAREAAEAARPTPPPAPVAAPPPAPVAAPAPVAEPVAVAETPAVAEPVDVPAVEPETTAVIEPAPADATEETAPPTATDVPGATGTEVPASDDPVTGDGTSSADDTATTDIAPADAASDTDSAPSEDADPVR